MANVSNILYKVEKMYLESKKEVLVQTKTGHVTDEALHKRELLKEIKKYRDEMEWLKKQETKDRIRFYISNGYSISKTSKVYGMDTDSAIKTSIWYASKQFRTAIGKDTLNLIENNELESAELEFKLNTGGLDIESFLIKGVTDLVPELTTVDKSISISECEKELKFLKNFSKDVIDTILSRIDIEKLALLMYMLKGKETDYTEQRALVYSYLTGDINDIQLLLLELKETE